MLGTDGAGAEHSDPLNQLLLAQELITVFKNSCIMKPNDDLSSLYHSNSKGPSAENLVLIFCMHIKEYLDWMQGKPVQGVPSPIY